MISGRKLLSYSVMRGMFETDSTCFTVSLYESCHLTKIKIQWQVASHCIDIDILRKYVHTYVFALHFGRYTIIPRYIIYTYVELYVVGII